MRVVGVAYERETADARELVLASGAPFEECREEATGERTEAIAVEVEAADLSAERVDVGAGILARGEGEPLHRVEVDIEAREPDVDRVVQPACAHDRNAWTDDGESLGGERVEIAHARRDHRVVRSEGFAFLVPAKVDVMARAERAEIRRVVD